MKQTNKNFIIEKAENARTEWKHSVRFSLYLFLITLFLISFSSGKLIVSNAELHGLHINSWDIENIPQNKPYTFIWDIDMNGMLIKANLTNCTFFIHPAGVIGTYFQGVATKTSDGNGWYQTIQGGNFTRLGQHDYQVDCYLLSNTTISGNLLGSVNVTPSGEINNTNLYYVLIFLFYAVAFIGFFGKNEWITMFGGMALIPLGLFMINSGVFTFRNVITDVLSWTTIGLGAFFVIYSGVEIIKENL